MSHLTPQELKIYEGSFGYQLSIVYRAPPGTPSKTTRVRTTVLQMILVKSVFKLDIYKLLQGEALLLVLFQQPVKLVVQPSTLVPQLLDLHVFLSDFPPELDTRLVLFRRFQPQFRILGHTLLQSLFDFCERLSLVPHRGLCGARVVVRTFAHVP